MATQTAQIICRVLIKTSSSFICFGVSVLDNVKAGAWNLVLGKMTYCLFLIRHLADLAQSQPVWKFFARKGKTLSTWDLTPKFASLNPCNVVFCCRRRSRCIVDKCLYTMFHLVSMSCFSKYLSSCRVSDDFYLSLIRKTFQFTVFSEHLQKKQLKFTSHHVPQA